MSLLNRIKQNKKLVSAIEYAVIMVVFLFTERTIRNNYFFVGTYRMQTVSKYLPIIFSLVIYVIFAYLISKGKIKTSGVLIPYFAVYIGYLLSTSINCESVDRWCDTLLYSAAPMVLTILVFQRKGLAKKYISAATAVFIVLASVNLLLWLFPKLWDYITLWRDECFFGYHTTIIWPLTMGMLFALLNGEYNDKKIPMYIYAAIYFANILIIRPGAAVVGALITLIWMVIPFVKKQCSKRSLIVFIVIALALFAVLMLGLEPFTHIPVVKFFIENVLHRNLTLSGRLYVWKGVRHLVSKAPLLGYGLRNSTQIYFDGEYNHAMVHAHNMFLQCLFEGGFITFVLGICMLIHTARITDRELKSSDYDVQKAVAGIFKMIIFNLLIILQSDQDTYYNWYIVAFTCNFYLVMMRSYSFNGKKE